MQDNDQDSAEEPFEVGPKTLPFPTIKYDFGDEVVEEYIIPDDKKAEVLEQLYFLGRPPELDDVFEDIHEGRTFRVRDYKVVKDSFGIWLVSPYYFSSGGTVIDWMPVRRRTRRPASPRRRTHSQDI